jgi:hypothetical protein
MTGKGLTVDRFGVATKGYREFLVDREIKELSRAPKLPPHVASRKGSGRGWAQVNLRSTTALVGVFPADNFRYQERRECERRCCDSPIYFAWPILDRRNVTRRSS